MLGAKLPAGMLVLLATGFAMAVLRRFRGLSLDVWLHGYFVIAFLALTFNAQINIGVRHALPVVPSLAILAAHAADQLWKAGHTRRLLAIACLMSVVAGTILAHPRYLGDFNWLVGGRRGGHQISVVGEDWGQDLGELAAWQQNAGVPISYSHWQDIRLKELERLGTKARAWRCPKPTPPGYWRALHLETLQRRTRCRHALAGQEPHAILNDHIYVYPPADDAVGPPTE